MSFDLSLFRTKSENAIDETVLDPDFITNLEIQQANKSIDEYILESPKSSINTTMTPELSEQLSTTLSSPLFPSASTIIPSEVHSSPPLIPTLPHQTIITHSSSTSLGSSSTAASSPSTSIPHLSLSQLT